MAGIIKAIKRLIQMLVFLLVAGAVGVFLFQQWKLRQGWPGGFDPQRLPRLSKTLRVGIVGRPVELPLKALHLVPQASDLKVELRRVRPDERWLLLASGEIDATLASLDELSLALPRFHPGLIMFPVAENAGSEGVVNGAKKGPPLVAYLPGGTSEALARSLNDRELAPVPAGSPEQALAWLDSGQVQAAALWEPALGQAVAKGGTLLTDTQRRPTMEVLVASRQIVKGTSPRSQMADLETLCVAWFQLVDQLQHEPGLAAKAVASENELTPEEVQKRFKGLTFLSINSLQQDHTDYENRMLSLLQSNLTFWSLSGAPNYKGAKFEDDLNQELLQNLPTVAGGPEGPVTPPAGTPTPGATETPGADNATTPAPSSPIDMLGCDPSRKGQAPGPALRETSAELWHSSTAKDIAVGLIYDREHDTVLAGSDDGNLYCLQVKTGGQKWRFPCGDKVRSTPALVGGRVYVGSNDARVACLDAATGSKKWIFQTGGDVLGSPAVVDGKVYCSSYEGKLWCLDASTGKMLWNVTMGGNVTSAPAVAQGTVVLGCSDKQVYAFDAETGKKSWTFKGGGGFPANPCIAGDKVFIGCQDHNFYALNLTTGARVWEKSTGDEITTGAAYLDGLVCFGSRDCNIYGVDAQTGTESWKFPTRERICSNAVVAEDVVYAASEDNRVYALEAPTGKLLWRHKVGGWPTTPVVVDRTCIFGCSDGRVYAIH